MPRRDERTLTRTELFIRSSRSPSLFHLLKFHFCMADNNTHCFLFERFDVFCFTNSACNCLFDFFLRQLAALLQLTGVYLRTSKEWREHLQAIGRLPGKAEVFGLVTRRFCSGISSCRPLCQHLWILRVDGLPVPRYAARHTIPRMYAACTSPWKFCDDVWLS